MDIQFSLHSEKQREMVGSDFRFENQNKNSGLQFNPGASPLLTRSKTPYLQDLRPFHIWLYHKLKSVQKRLLSVGVEEIKDPMTGVIGKDDISVSLGA